MNRCWTSHERVLDYPSSSCPNSANPDWGENFANQRVPVANAKFLPERCSQQKLCSCKVFSLPLQSFAKTPFPRKNFAIAKFLLFNVSRFCVNGKKLQLQSFFFAVAKFVLCTWRGRDFTKTPCDDNPLSALMDCFRTASGILPE